MSSDQWVLDQLIALYGIPYAISLFATANKELVNRLYTGPTVLSSGRDLLPLALSYVSLSDIRNVMLTCKAFYAATQKRDFWRVNVERFKSRIANGVIDKTKARAIRRFDTFLVNEESIREQVQFIFNKKWRTLRGTLELGKAFNKHLMAVSRVSSEDVYVLHEYDPDTLELVYVYTCPNTVHGLIKRWTMSSNRDLISYAEFHCNGFDKIDTTKPCVVHRRFDNGDVYKGEGIYDPTVKQLMCHGSGKWEFAQDGTILEGKGVAYMNEPRFLTREHKRIKV